MSFTCTVIDTLCCVDSFLPRLYVPGEHPELIQWMQWQEIK